MSNKGRDYQPEVFGAFLLALYGWNPSESGNNNVGCDLCGRQWSLPSAATATTAASDCVASESAAKSVGGAQQPPRDSPGDFERASKRPRTETTANGHRAYSAGADLESQHRWFCPWIRCGKCMLGSLRRRREAAKGNGDLRYEPPRNLQLFSRPAFYAHLYPLVFPRRPLWPVCQFQSRVTAKSRQSLQAGGFASRPPRQLARQEDHPWADEIGMEH